MITDMAMHGLLKECHELFEKMVNDGVRPNVVTFVGVLCACVHDVMIWEALLRGARMHGDILKTECAPVKTIGNNIHIFN